MEKQILGSYELRGKLGEGTFGAVYVGTHLVLGRPAAVKILKVAGDKEESDRRLHYFIREARILAQLEHEHIVKIYDAFHTDFGPCIAMEFINGDTLQGVSKNYDLSLGEIASFMAQTLDGLGDAHDGGIVHRDLKPSNILIRTDGHVKLADFGIAAGFGDSYLGTSVTGVGTLPYMSPEQVRGEELDPRSDIWSMGVILYELVTRELPFRGKNAAQLMHSIVTCDHPPLPKECPQWVHEFIAGSLQPAMSDRYLRCSDLARLLPIKTKTIINDEDLNPEDLLKAIVKCLPDRGAWVDKEDLIRRAARLSGVERVGKNIRHQFIKAILRGVRRNILVQNLQGQVSKI